MKKKLLLSIFCFLAIIEISFGQDSLLTATPKSAVKQVIKIEKSPGALGISPSVLKNVAKMKNPPTNIALFAVDRRNDDQQGNSDVIMIISIDQQQRSIKMSSILRDTYVKIEGKGMDKINAAYAFGGPQLAIKTLNQNFSLDIHDYINVDFVTAAKIVNALGGIVINVKEEELPYLNNYLAELSNLNGAPYIPVKTAGPQSLNGEQTVAYTRIRAVGHGDYERTERQRNVMIALFAKLQGAGTSVFPVFMSEILPYLETSMNNMSLFAIGSNILGSKSKAIDQARFPLDSQSKGERINNIWYLKTDLAKTTDSIHGFIYNGNKPGK